MGGIRVARIDRKSSIENEPRTLNFTQIHIAREAALYVVHTRSREEACRIFTEGLEPVDNIGGLTTPMMPKSGEFSDEEHDLCSFNNRPFRRTTAKDILTAPF
ncbi:hypothetical protein RND81_12G159800 [Saponaria officinalis]|uniref:Uncharacterized protein n=1 Tax=Saponaria officinalis TaxID=3572 RepID=A0AAW1HB66_SAPOF